VLLLALLLACAEESRVPEGALFYDVTVTATADSCHPDATEGYEETFRYAVFFGSSASADAASGARAEVYVDEELFAVGSIAGCSMSYQTVVFGEDTEADGNVKWQLTGAADLDRGDDSCVPTDKDWEGEETFEVIAAPDESVAPGCTYETATTGTVVSTEGA
jgi:hypothetical protein